MRINPKGGESMVENDILSWFGRSTGPVSRLGRYQLGSHGQFQHLVRNERCHTGLAIVIEVCAGGFRDRSVASSLL